jgi:hypothetical protein
MSLWAKRHFSDQGYQGIVEKEDKTGHEIILVKLRMGLEEFQSQSFG